jgi:hypothetical protein
MERVVLWYPENRTRSHAEKNQAKQNSENSRNPRTSRSISAEQPVHVVTTRRHEFRKRLSWIERMCGSLHSARGCSAGCTSGCFRYFQKEDEMK